MHNPCIQGSPRFCVTSPVSGVDCADCAQIRNSGADPAPPVSAERPKNLGFSSIQSPARAIIITVTNDTTPTLPQFPNPPMICRLGVGLLGVLVALSALPWLWFSIGRFGAFDWGLFGFELITIIAGIYAVLLAMGKFREGWGIGVTAIAGSIMVTLVFGLYVGFVMAKKDDYPDLYPLAKYTLMGRAAIIGGFFALASLAVFARNSASIGFIIKAALCAAPLAIVGGLMHFHIGPGVWINDSLANSSGTGALQAILALVLGLFFIVLISAAGHLLIRAYECGRPTEPKSE